MKTLVALIRLLILLAAMAGSFLAGQFVPPTEPSRPPRAPVYSDSSPTLEAIQKLSSLMITRVAVADVSQTRIDGYAGGITTIIVIRGDFLLGVDLTHAKFNGVDKERHIVTVVLPPPRVSSPRLDQEKTRLLSVNRQGLWTIVPGNNGQEAAVNHAYRHAQEIVAAAGSDPTLLEDARHRAGETLVGFFSAIGWTVMVHWEDRP